VADNHITFASKSQLAIAFVAFIDILAAVSPEIPQK
jgi:hypothetical protein